MTESASPHAIPLRRTDNNERFVAFAFAAADLVVEVDSASGHITYAAGAFQARFEKPAEAYLGGPPSELVDAHDRITLDTALMLLLQKGRLPPLLIRLADKARTAFALAGIVLAPAGAARRMCLTFALAPAPMTEPPSIGPAALARTAQARLRQEQPTAFGLIEIRSKLDAATLDAAFGSALRSLAPDALASGVACGRFGVLGTGGPLDLQAIAASLESALRAQGETATAVASADLLAGAASLTPTQAARAMRQALTVFARQGAAALEDTGFGGGLAGYVGRLESHAMSLRKSIKDRRFALVYQPVVTLAEGQAHHYEALIRPQPVPGCTLADTQEFVTLVETLGMTDDLDFAVATEVCAITARESASVAFNLSAQSLQMPAFRDRLLRLLASSPACRTGRLLIEMTETGELDQLQEVAASAKAFQGLGIRFCLDDFGAGTADMRVLRALPADIVKLDGSYVPGVVHGGRERALVAGVVEIAHAAGAKVVAEQIETEIEAEAMRSINVDFGQGYLFGRPGSLPPAAASGRAARARRSQERETWG